MSSIADDPAELRALRERAYGPDPDIQEDPRALMRLHELEDRAREKTRAAADAPPEDGGDLAPTPLSTSDTPVPSVEADAPHDGDAAADAEYAADVDPVRAPASSVPTPRSGADETVSDETDGRPWWRRRLPLLWAGSLVVATLLGAGIASSLHAIGAGQVAVLAADEDAEWPEQFFNPPPEGAIAFEEFHGLSVLKVPEGFGPGAETYCLYVTAPDPGSFEMATAGCSAGSFPASAAFVVTPQAPDELLERYASGTALQFVLDGSEVRVYAAAP